MLSRGGLVLLVLRCKAALTVSLLLAETLLS